MQVVHQSLVATSALPGFDFLKDAAAAQGSKAPKAKIQTFAVTGPKGGVAQGAGQRRAG